MTAWSALSCENTSRSGDAPSASSCTAGGSITALRRTIQLDLFDPDDGYYEYSAVATNKAVTGRTLWYFMCGRGTHEKVYGELKNGFAFDCVPSQRFEANSAWQVVSVIVFNLTRGFQALTTAPVQAVEPQTSHPVAL